MHCALCCHTHYDIRHMGCFQFQGLLELNPLNATGVYIRLIFTSRERERRIYTPAIYSGPNRANRRRLAAVRGKTLLI